MIWLLAITVSAMAVFVGVQVWPLPRRNRRGHRLARWMAIQGTLQ